MNQRSRPDIAIVDKSLIDTLLLMAVDEGLLFENQQADGYIARLRKHNLPVWTREQVLEQIVLTPELISFHPGWGSIEAFDGPLVETGLISHIEPDSTEPEFDVVPVEALLGMLHARGIAIDTAEMVRRMAAAQEAEREEEEFETRSGKSAPRGVEAAMIRALALAGLVEPPYTDDEYVDQDRRSAVYSAAEPIAACFLEFLRVRDVASKLGALSRTATLTIGSGFLAPPHLQDVETESMPMVLFRLVAAEMGRIPYRPSLKETLKLAKDPASAALRERVKDWIHAIQNGELNKLGHIRRDIEHAKRALQRAGVANTVGRMATWASAPAAVADMLLGLPGILGGATTVTCVTSLAWSSTEENRNRWAMFGSI